MEVLQYKSVLAGVLLREFLILKAGNDKEIVTRAIAMANDLTDKVFPPDTRRKKEDHD
jgi:hypothetical protein